MSIARAIRRGGSTAATSFRAHAREVLPFIAAAHIRSVMVWRSIPPVRLGGAHWGDWGGGGEVGGAIRYRSIAEVRHQRRGATITSSRAASSRTIRSTAGGGARVENLNQFRRDFPKPCWTSGTEGPRHGEYEAANALIANKRRPAGSKPCGPGVMRRAHQTCMPPQRAR